jgi:hypothetical protein
VPEIDPMRSSLPPLALLACLAAVSPVRADAFDHYLRPVLDKAIESGQVKEVKELTPDLIGDNDRVLPSIPAAFLIVRTNDNRLAKLLVQPAGQRVVGTDRTVRMLLVERYVTYKEGEEQTILASGKNLALFPGFRLSLDLGQVVPEELGGDIQFVVDGNKVVTRPIGKAKIYLVTKAIPGIEPKKGEKLVVGDKFEPRYFTGTFKLYDDGRRSGKLVLKVEDDKTVSGFYYSDRDGAKYDIYGQIGKPTHALQFTIKFPRAEQIFQGMMFTGDGRVIAGTSRLQERESGFYAVREE